MTTFNGGRYLGEQLASLSSQTVKPFQLVVCDDGSSDQSAGILQSLSELAPFPVKILTNRQRLSYKQNFIKAASLWNGSLIAFFYNLSLSGLSPVINLKGCSLIFRREVIELVGWPPPEVEWSHDGICFAALLLGKRGYTDQLPIRNRVHKNNRFGLANEKGYLTKAAAALPVTTIH